jgi:hypothetical protein
MTGWKPETRGAVADVARLLEAAAAAVRAQNWPAVRHRSLAAAGMAAGMDLDRAVEGARLTTEDTTMAKETRKTPATLEKLVDGKLDARVTEANATKPTVVPLAGGVRESGATPSYPKTVPGARG